jgi:hypothetical protein
MFGLMLMYLVTSLLLGALAIPLLQRKIKPNALYGLRTPKTMKNPDIWYPANAYMAKWLLGVGILGVISSLVFYVAGLDEGTYVAIVGSVIGFGVLVMVIVAILHLRQYP